jgi:hypothetical protein
VNKLIERYRKTTPVSQTTGEPGEPTLSRVTSRETDSLTGQIEGSASTESQSAN